MLAVSENNGDIILTEGFQNYVNATGFDIFLCHGSDPESKGRVKKVNEVLKNEDWSSPSYEDKNKLLFFRQKRTLDLFLARGAIS